MSVTTIPVNGPQPYSVTIGHGLTRRLAEAIADLDCQRIAIVHQPPLSHAADHLAGVLEEQAGLVPHLLPVPDAEAGKELHVLGHLWDHMGARGFGRRDVVVGLGGGATTDLAGFLAATWMRGIRVIQVPTSLLAMVDAAVGGKTGINTAAGKNLVGAFHEPSGVFVDLEYLRALPPEELVSGSAEIVKTGFIADPVILDRYETDPAACLDVAGFLPELVERSIAVKVVVVGHDLKESGPREALNYGHTFGHAVERRENYRWRHGHAVAVGMIYAAHLAQLTGFIDADVVSRHYRILESIGLPVSYPDGHFAELHDAMKRDKKNRGGHIRFVLLDGREGATTRFSDATIDHLTAAYSRTVAEM